MMKFNILALSCFLVFACAKGGRSHDNGGGTTNTPTVKADGGVDIGNKPKECNIPGTKIYLTHPESWPCNQVKRSAATETEENQKIIITNTASSRIEAFRVKIKLDPLTPANLKRYLDNKFKDHILDYTPVVFNGLKGFRAEILNTADAKKSDIYLMSELGEVIHITSDLNNTEDGILTGDKIITTVSLKYKGEAIKNSTPKSILLDFYDFQNRSKSLKDIYFYSFLNEFFCDKVNFCQGEYISLERPDKSKSENRLNINTAGRFVRLGNESQVPFDSIQIQGKYLITPNTQVAIQNIYTTFSPDKQIKENRSIIPVVGDVYLVRIMDWPKSDLIVKMRIDSFDSDHNISITYQNLIAVPATTLQDQINEMNAATLEHDAPRNEGEVTLFNDNVWGETGYSSFNFKYSNSGNKFITKHSDLIFNECENFPVFKSYENSATIEIENKKMEEIEKSDFVNLKYSYSGHNTCGHRIEVGKTYGFTNQQPDESTYGAFKVLEIGKNNSWVRIKFRRISVESREQNKTVWLVDEDTSNYMQESEERGPDYRYEDNALEFMLIRFTYYPKLAISLDSDLLCIHPKDCGVYNFGRIGEFEKMSATDLINKKGQYVTKSDISMGDVVGIWREDSSYKRLVVIKIDEIAKNNTVKYRQRVLEAFYASEVPANSVESSTKEQVRPPEGGH